MKIAFLHTSKSHVKRFRKIINEIDNNIEVEHYVNEVLLETAMKEGQVDVKGFINEIRKIKNTGIENIICTCSTYGNLCNEDENIYRIDKPIGEYITSNFSRIGIAYSVNSTKSVSKELIEKLAFNAKKTVQIFELNCEHCWDWFEKGDINRYEIEIANQIKSSANKCELIFLAQASMEGAKKYLTDVDYEVVSSPKFGVEKYLELIKKKTTPARL